MASNDARVFGGKINMIAEDIASQFNVSRCEAIGIVGQVMLEKFDDDRIKLTPEEKSVVEDFVLAACLNDNDYLFRE